MQWVFDRPIFFFAMVLVVGPLLFLAAGLLIAHLMPIRRQRLLRRKKRVDDSGIDLSNSNYPNKTKPFT